MGPLKLILRKTKCVSSVNLFHMKKFVPFVLVCALFLAGCSSGPSGGQTPEEATAIARCLDDKGVEMYGAFWCPHCADQKKVFGSEAEKHMPYNECDPKGDNPVTETCLELDIENYPTWIFPDGTRQTGVIPLTDLQSQSGCTGPELEQYFVTEAE